VDAVPFRLVQQFIHALWSRHFVDEVQRIRQYLWRIAVRNHEDLDDPFVVEAVRLAWWWQRYASAVEEGCVRLQESDQVFLRDSHQTIRMGKPPKVVRRHFLSSFS